MTRSDPTNERPTLFLTAWAVTLLVAMAVTWRLWTPWRDVPRLAPRPLIGSIPAGIDFVLLALLGYGLVRTVPCAASWRRGVTIATVALMGLMALDQLRWQPWAYHAAIAGVVLATSTARDSRRLLRVVTIGVYAYSAIAKLDAEFAATLGQQFLGAMPLDLSGLEESTRQALALAFPCGELLLAALLAAALRLPRLRRGACVAAAAMHAATIGLLGPWALGHSWGVLVWNAGFAWQTIVLFWPQDEVADDRSTRSSSLALAACGLAVLAPALTPLGWWDQWPGWALYAPGGERAMLFVHSASLERLPPSLTAFIDEDGNGPWRRVRLDEWALQSTGAPLYPQNRIVAAMAVALMERYPLTGRVRVVTESMAGRLSRERRVNEYRDLIEISAAARLFGPKPGIHWTKQVTLKNRPRMTRIAPMKGAHASVPSVSYVVSRRQRIPASWPTDSALRRRGARPAGPRHTSARAPAATRRRASP